MRTPPPSETKTLQKYPNGNKSRVRHKTVGDRRGSPAGPSQGGPSRITSMRGEASVAGDFKTTGKRSYLHPTCLTEEISSTFVHKCSACFKSFSDWLKFTFSETLGGGTKENIHVRVNMYKHVQ